LVSRAKSVVKGDKVFNRAGNGPQLDQQTPGWETRTR
jgi:hypothetical protein